MLLLSEYAAASHDITVTAHEFGAAMHGDVHSIAYRIL